MVEAEELKNLFQQEIIGGLQPPLPPVVTALNRATIGVVVGRYHCLRCCFAEKVYWQKYINWNRTDYKTFLS